MKPVDFVVFNGDSSPNMPAYKVAEAMHKDIKVFGPTGELQILSYYYDHKTGRLVLEVDKK